MSVLETFILYRNLLDTDISLKFAFLGTSMEPTICEKAIITIEKVDNLKIGEIYVYYDEEPTERLVCHRFIKKVNEQLLFKGDNRRQADRPIVFAKVLGKVTEVQRDF